MTVRILVGDCLDRLRELPDASVHCVMTSPPYWGLRDYGTATWEGGDPECDHVVGTDRNDSGQRCGALTGGPLPGGTKYARAICPKCGAIRVDDQLGLEETPEEYIAKMADVFREVRRVMRDDATLWLNMGDSYARSGKSTTLGAASTLHGGLGFGPNDKVAVMQSGRAPTPPGPKPKDLVGIPWRLALALQADGWWLRSDIIWAKTAPMPESVRDRPTKSHEYIFLLTKAARYFYDSYAVREEAVSDHVAGNKSHKYVDQYTIEKESTQQHRTKAGLKELSNIEWKSRNRRTVWTLGPEPFPGSHFAVFPTTLPEICIAAGTSERGCCPACGAPWERVEEKEISGNNTGTALVDYGMYSGRAGESHITTLGFRPTCDCYHLPGHAEPVPCTVLDPFGGAGTVGLVADRMGRDAILIELNPDYAEMARKRIVGDAPMFTNVTLEGE